MYPQANSSLTLLLVGVIVLFLQAQASFAATIQAETASGLEMLERSAIRSYEREDYELAAKQFTKAAHAGMKQSQYLLGFMYLKGQHLQQSLTEGMAWLGVAKESGNKDWEATFDKIYNKSKNEQLTAIDERVAHYVKLYGMHAQSVSCERRRTLRSNRWTVECVKISEVREQIYTRDEIRLEQLVRPGFWNY